jgi:rRNA maturation endonuclease Nob1
MAKKASKKPAAAKKAAKRKPPVRPEKAAPNAAKTRKFAERKKELDARRQHLERLEKKLGAIDFALADIEKEILASRNLRSVLVDEDLREKKTLAMHVEKTAARPHDRAFYRRFILRCEDCRNQFERELKVKPLEERLYCPACGRDHTIGVRPSTRIHSIALPKTLKIVGHR